MHVLKVAFLKFGLKGFIPRKKLPGSFALRGFLNELLNKFPHLGLGGLVDFIPLDPNWCIFHTPGSFIPHWYPALKVIALLYRTF